MNLLSRISWQNISLYWAVRFFDYNFPKMTFTFLFFIHFFGSFIRNLQEFSWKYCWNSRATAPQPLVFIKVLNPLGKLGLRGDP